ncbi:MAG: hypothetical protein M0Z95_03440 [Actinomycetota bacterium]|jgi:hypothetical protein|nr:hypothetical protein [Actinomycetota bacterium]
MSIAVQVVVPVTAEQSVKTPRPVQKTALAPRRSTRAPPESSRAANAGL